MITIPRSQSQRYLTSYFYTDLIIVLLHNTPSWIHLTSYFYADLILAEYTRMAEELESHFILLRRFNPLYIVVDAYQFDISLHTSTQI